MGFKDGLYALADLCMNTDCAKCHFYDKNKDKCCLDGKPPANWDMDGVVEEVEKWKW